MIACRNVTMEFGAFRSLDNFSLDVARGGICELLGPNGAGKSTTLKILAGLLASTAGTVTIDGRNPRDAKHLLGVMPENLGLFDDLTIEEHLLLTCDIYGAPRERIRQLLRVLSIEKGKNTPASECSHGMRKKTSFAMALLPNPRILLLDEPFEAVDPVSARLMFDVLRDAAKRGVAILLTSHMLSIVERLADRVALLREGKLVHCGPLDDASLEQKYFELVEAPLTETLEWFGSSES